MTVEPAALWDRLESFAFDDQGSALTFTRRLARENRWSVPYARRVVDEYRRFLFLAMAAGHPVTPSDQVDQVWHLHLTYTRSYWDELCRDVLETPLHHGPTRGGPRESAKYHDWYARTLDSYARHFGHEPPTDIWPPAAQRFGRDLHFARVNTQTHWVIPRPSRLAEGLVSRFVARRPTRPRPGGTISPRRRRLPGATLAMLAVVSMILVGCHAARGAGLPLLRLDLTRMSGSEFLALYVPLTIIAVLGSIALRVWIRDRNQPSRIEDLDDVPAATNDPAKLDPYELVLLGRGPQPKLAAQAAVARLVDEGVLAFDPESRQMMVGVDPTGRRLHPIEEAALDETRTLTSPTIGEIVHYVSGIDSARSLPDRLRQRGLTVSEGRAVAMRVYPLLLLFATSLLGFWRIGLGLSRGRPVGFLIVLCGGLLAAMFIHLATRPWRTRQGSALLDGLRRQHGRTLKQPVEPSSALFPLAFALFGVSVLPASGLSGSLRKEFLPPPADGGGGCGGDGGSGDGGGDGGGGCGGGGGGCGGGGCGGCGGG